MQNFQDTFETRKRSFISAFSVCMTVPLNMKFIECTRNEHVQALWEGVFQIKS